MYLPGRTLCVAVSLVLVGMSRAEEAEKPPAKGYWAFIGTYTTGKSKGIYRFAFDPGTGKLAGGELVAQTKEPSFLAVSPDNRFLFAVNEVDNFAGRKSGAVSAFALDPATGTLKFLNQQPTGGAHPCHLVVDKSGKHVLAANYTGGSVCVLPIGPDGRLGNATSFVQHKGSSVNPRRQEGPHAHSINLDPSGQFAFVADLGLDQVLVYRYDAMKGTLSPNNPPSVSLAPGAGPRHFAFHPGGKLAFVINELDSTLTTMHYDPSRGRLKVLSAAPTLPGSFKGESSTAEVRPHPSGKFVFGSNRGHDSIVSFRVDPDSGMLSYVGHQATGIKTPRNFNIDPTGAFLVVANQNGDSLVVFRIDQVSGQLQPTGQKVEAPSPVCIRFVPRQ